MAGLYVLIRPDPADRIANVIEIDDMTVNYCVGLKVLMSDVHQLVAAACLLKLDGFERARTYVQAYDAPALFPKHSVPRERLRTGNLRFWIAVWERAVDLKPRRAKAQHPLSRIGNQGQTQNWRLAESGVRELRKGRGDEWRRLFGLHYQSNIKRDFRATEPFLTSTPYQVNTNFLRGFNRRRHPSTIVD